MGAGAAATTTTASTSLKMARMAATTTIAPSPGRGVDGGVGVGAAVEEELLALLICKHQGEELRRRDGRGTRHDGGDHRVVVSTKARHDV